jgi:hypothetical protein
VATLIIESADYFRSANIHERAEDEEPSMLRNCFFISLTACTLATAALVTPLASGKDGYSNVIRS